MNNKLTQKDFLEKIISVHGDKYDYSKVNYITKKKNVIIICKKHGEFEQRAERHLSGSGCVKCHNESRIKLTTETWKNEAINIHSDKYDYSKVNYKNNNNKIIIICKIHGDFHQRPDGHLKGYGCKKCADVYNSKLFSSNTTTFIDKARIIHGDRYDYTKTNYINSKIKVIIICKLHGEFLQTPNKHLKGNSGCSICSKIKMSTYKRSTTKEFIEKSKKIHGDKYDYSKVEYITSRDKVIITCKIHGDFFQSPSNHLIGFDCNKCRGKYSKEQIKWLNFMQIRDECYIQHAINETEFIIPNTNYKADGYCRKNNTIYEYYGDFWHGNPKIYEANKNNVVSKKTYGELYNITCHRENYIKNLGYNLVTIWESEWLNFIKCIKILQKKYKKRKNIKK
jgi:hypothetical protein